jgi:Mannanase, galactose-binding domain-like
MARTDGVETTEERLAGSTAVGVVPQGLPARLAVGLFEDTGATWMKNSGVKWDERYRYVTKGWVNNWGYSAYDGSWALSYLQETAQQGFVPALQYYQLVGEAGGGEEATLAKVQNAGTMQSYFGDFKILMQRVKDFGKPTLVLLEADGVGFLEQQSGGNPNAYAAVAASGMPELSGLPNAVAGFGLAYLKIKQAVGASNAILGLHVSAWATGKDIASYNVTDALQPEVDKAYAFLSPMGLTSNATGAQYDVLVGDPLDRDGDYYRVVQGSDRTWDPSDSASISSRSFNRYAEWLRLWNLKAQKRWVLWQIPLGNSSSKNVWDNGGPAEGYKDNRPEYFFASGTAHMQKFANVGVISLLFGAGASGQSTYDNDTYSDGQLFMQSRAAVVLNAGGVAIATAPPPADTARYNFETSAQGWVAAGTGVTVASSTDRAFSGTHSLKVSFSNASSGYAKLASPPTPAGATVTFRVWIPSGTVVASIQPYVLQGANGGWAWTGNWQPLANLHAGAWYTTTVQVPANASALAELGVQFSLNGSQTGALYVDSVNW